MHFRWTVTRCQRYRVLEICSHEMWRAQPTGFDELGFSAKKTFTVRCMGHLYMLMCQQLTAFKGMDVSFRTMTTFSIMSLF